MFPARSGEDLNHVRRKKHARNIGRKGFPRNGPTTNPHVHQPQDESDSLRCTTRHELRRNTIHIHQTHVVHKHTCTPRFLPKVTVPQAWEDKTHKKRRRVNNHKQDSHVENKSTPNNTQNNLEFDCPKKDNNNTQLETSPLKPDGRRIRLATKRCRNNVTLPNTPSHLNRIPQKILQHTFYDRTSRPLRKQQKLREKCQGQTQNIRSSHESRNLSTPT